MRYNVNLSQWIAREKGIPQALENIEIMGETEKAVRILYNNMFYWVPKSHAKLEPVKEPPESLGPSMLFQKKLFPFQEVGVRSLIQMKSALLADEMGLGKTIQSIAYAVRSRRLPVLVTCPASVAINWEREIVDAVPYVKVQRISSGSDTLQPGNDFYIIPYSLVTKYEEVSMMGIRLLVLDEVHYVKNYKARRTQTMIRIADAIPNRLGLSGTPVTNHDLEIFTVMRCIDSTVFSKDFYMFLREFCTREQIGFPWHVPDWKKQSLADRLKGRMIRRTKAEVISDLPAKLTSSIHVSVPLKDYHASLRNMAEEYFKSTGHIATDLTMLEKERQLCGGLKAAMGLEFVEDILDQGESVVLFAQHKNIVNYLYLSPELKKYNPQVIRGSQSPDKRQEAVDAFQEGRSKVIVVSIQAGGIGINLTRASKAVFFEFDWSAASMRQAEDRIHRIGQRSSVNIYYIVAKGTLDEYIMRVLEGKAKSFHDLVDTERKELLLKFS